MARKDKVVHLEDRREATRIKQQIAKIKASLTHYEAVSLELKNLLQQLTRSKNISSDAINFLGNDIQSKLEALSAGRRSIEALLEALEKKLINLQ